MVNQLNITQEEAAERLGKSRPAVANALRLPQLSETIQDLLADNKLTAGLPGRYFQLQTKKEGRDRSHHYK